MHNHYWDLNECRWVHYVHRDVDELGSEVAAVPAQRTDEPAPDVVTEPALPARAP